MIEIQKINEIEAELNNHHDAKLRLKLLFLRFLYRNFDDMEYACEALKLGRQLLMNGFIDGMREECSH